MTTRVTQRFIILTIALLVWSAAVAVFAETKPDYARINAAAIQLHIVPRYQALARETVALDVGIKSFCGAPSDAGLQQVRALVHRTWDAWARIQHISFGPIAYLSRNARFQFWPSRRDKTGRHLAALLRSRDRGKLDPEVFAKTSVAVQGLPAVERLLFGEDAGLLLTRDDAAAYRCSVLVAIGSNLSRIAAGTMADWVRPDGFAEQIARIGTPDALFETDAELTMELVKSMSQALESASRLKLRRPLGASIGKARGKRTEAWRSRRSLRNIALALEAVDDLYRLNAQGFGFALHEVGHPSIDYEMDDALKAAVRAVNKVDRPLADAIAHPTARKAVAEAARRIEFVQGLLLQPVSIALSINPGFNSLDGD